RRHKVELVDDFVTLQNRVQPRSGDDGGEDDDGEEGEERKVGDGSRSHRRIGRDSPRQRLENEGNPTPLRVTHPLHNISTPLSKLYHPTSWLILTTPNTYPPHHNINPQSPISNLQSPISLRVTSSLHQHRPQKDNVALRHASLRHTQTAQRFRHI